MTQNTNTVTAPQFASAQTLYQGSLLTAPDDYAIARLQPEHLPAIIDLHKQAIAALKNDEKAFMLLKEDSFFRNHFNRAAGNAVLGIICKDQLIGEAIILHPTETAPDTGMTDMPAVGKADSVTVLQAVTVLPDYRKNGLMHQMVHVWLNHAWNEKKHHALAEVEVHNISSWSAFLNEGLQITGIGVDPDDGALLYNMHETLPEIMKKRLTQTFNQEAANTITCPIDDFHQQQDRLDHGFIISGWKSASREFILSPRP